jgi:hypothetical protein
MAAALPLGVIAVEPHTTAPDVVGAKAEPDRLWEQITVDFREACLLRREGKSDEANYILEQDLPQAIAEWSKAFPEKAEAKRSRLLAMFAEEQKRVESAVAVERIVSQKLSTNLVPALCAGVAREVRGVVSDEIAALRSAMAEAALVGALPRPGGGQRPRVKFDDVPGVIDTVLIEQTADSGARPVPSLAL